LSRSERKIVQYLNEAYAAELGLGRDMQAEIAIIPAGRYRTLLERHLRETDRHAERLGSRLAELGETRGRLALGIDTATTLAAQLLRIGNVPLELVRRSAGEDRVLRSAKESCAAEALEIATYTALERIAKDADDRRTAKLAASIRADEEAMLKKILAELPGLAAAVARATFEVVPPRTPTQTAGQRAGPGTPRDVPEPWAGYAGLTAVEVIAALDGAGTAVCKRARAYEQAGKRRSTVIQATERELGRS